MYMLTGRPRPLLKCTLFEPNTEKGGGACWTGAQQTKKWPGQVSQTHRCTLTAARSGHSRVHIETLQPRSEVRLHAIKGEQPNMAFLPCDGHFYLCERQSGTHTCVLRQTLPRVLQSSCTEMSGNDHGSIFTVGEEPQLGASFALIVGHE